MVYKVEVYINANKSKIVYLVRTKKTDIVFKIENEKNDLVQLYKYLCLLLEEYLKFESCWVIIAKSGGRALASFMNKYNVDNNINRDIFTHLFNICISSILLVKHVALINVMKVIECNIEPCSSF